MYQKFQISILVYQLWGETTFLVPSQIYLSPTVFSHPGTWDFSGWCDMPFAMRLYLNSQLFWKHQHITKCVFSGTKMRCRNDLYMFWRGQFFFFLANQVLGSKKCRKLRGKLNITVVFVIISWCVFKGKGCFIRCLSFFYVSLLLQIPCEKVFRYSYLKPSPKPLVEGFGA